MGTEGKKEPCKVYNLGSINLSDFLYIPRFRFRVYLGVWGCIDIELI